MRALAPTPHGVAYLHEEDGKTYVGERVDVDANLERVQRMRHHAVRSEVLGDCVASIPLAAIAQWGQQLGLTVDQVANDDALLDRCIADYSKFKVKGGVF